MPSATAPLDTKTTSFFRRGNSAICSAQRPSAAWSSPWPSFVTRLLPTLTTKRTAFVAMDFIASISWAGVIFGVGGHLCLGLRPDVAFQMFHDRERQVLSAFTSER